MTAVTEPGSRTGGRTGWLSPPVLCSTLALGLSVLLLSLSFGIERLTADGSPLSTDVVVHWPQFVVSTLSAIAAAGALVCLLLRRRSAARRWLIGLAVAGLPTILVTLLAVVGLLSLRRGGTNAPGG